MSILNSFCPYHFYFAPLSLKSMNFSHIYTGTRKKQNPKIYINHSLKFSQGCKVDNISIFTDKDALHPGSTTGDMENL